MAKNEFKEKVIGRVSATEKNPSTTDEFYFWTDQCEILSPFDIVKIHHLPNDESVTYAVVQEISHVTDSASHFASYISSDFGNVSAGSIGNMDKLGMNYVKSHVIMNTDDIYMPALNNHQVYLCSEEDIKKALGLKVENGIVCGYLSMYKGKENINIPVQINYHFLIGNDGAHLNISGISGLAAKTSYTMFLMNAIQQKLCFESKLDIAFVIFNVKTRDLLAIDESNPSLSEKDKELYRLLELKEETFKNVTYYYPFDHRSDNDMVSYVDLDRYNQQSAQGKAFKYYLPYTSTKEKLNLLFATEDDSSGTMESCLKTIMNEEENFNNIERWDKLKEEVESRKDGKKYKDSDVLVSSWKKFSRILKKYVEDDSIFNDTEEVDKKDLTDVVYNHLKGGDVMVLDIAKLDDNTQNYVFSSVIKDIYDMKFGMKRTSDTKIPDKVIIFVDELNKFASKEQPKSPILKNLLDVTERGRSQGVILFAAEQFRSAIFDRVKGNCSTDAYGRTNSVEISKPDYQYIPPTYKNMMTRLPAGEYIISNPALRSLVRIKFPYNLYNNKL